MYLIKRIYQLIVESKIVTLSGSFAFFLLFNGGSFFFLFIALSNGLPFDFRSLIVINLEDGLLKNILLYFIHHNYSLSYSIFLVITSIYSSSSLYYHFMHITETLIDKDINRNKRIKSLSVVVIVLVTISIMLSIITIFLSYNYYVYKVTINIFFIIIVIFLIYILNVVGLNTLSIKKIYKGIIFSNLYILIITILFITYIITFSNLKIIYGVFSFLIIFMLYVYLISIGMLVGIYINGKNIDVYKLIKK